MSNSNYFFGNLQISTGVSHIKEIDVPKPLGFDIGYLGMPSYLGQGLVVLEHTSLFGKKCGAW